MPRSFRPVFFRYLCKMEQFLIHIFFRRQNKRIDFHPLFLILQKFLNSIDVIRITMCHKNILQFSDPLR